MTSSQSFHHILLVASFLLTITVSVAADKMMTAFVPFAARARTTRTIPSIQTVASTALAEHEPPSGASYEKVLSLPVLGKQSFHLDIMGDHKARLRINGVMSVDEELDYSVQQNGAFSLDLPHSLQKVLKRFRTKLVEFGYDRDTDIPYVVVAPPLPTKIRIQLRRQ